MTTTYLGAQSIGGSMPAVVTGLAAALQLALPPPYSPKLEAALVALIQQCIRGNIAFLPMLTKLGAQRDLVTDLQGHMANAGLHAYSYAGPVNGLGGEFATALAGGLPSGAPTDSANALMLVTTTPATWVGLGQILKVTP